LFATFVIFVVGCLLALTIVAIFIAIIGNLRGGMAYRKALAERLEALRLKKALGRFGVDSAVFLHTRPVNEIEDQMRACSGCGELTRCDDTLDEKTPAQDFSFCPNFDSLSELKDSTVASVPRG
jgi:hypothetical protein